MLRSSGKHSFSSSSPTVLSLGELLWDMLPGGKRAGGAPVNFAYHAAANGCTAYAASAVGTDELGAELASVAESSGVHMLLAHVHPWPTGTVDVELDAGIPRYTIVENVAWDYVPPSPELTDIAALADAVCFGTLGMRNEVSRSTFLEALCASSPTALKFFDANLRGDFYSRELIEELLGYANVVKINDDELVILQDMLGVPQTPATATGDPAPEVLDSSDDPVKEAAMWFIQHYDLQYFILTAGAEYSFVCSKDGSSSRLETPYVPVVDTVGAGDSFSGSFIASILNGMPLSQAHRRAVNVSSYVCTQNGAWPTYPPQGIPDYCAAARI